MKKTKKETTKESHEEKGFLDLAGQAMTVLGHEIVEAKDVIMEAASEKLTAVKKAIKKIGKKAPVAARKAKPQIAKKAAKKVAKKAISSPVKKVAKKKAIPKKKK
jgi:hypothetical protein